MVAVGQLQVIKVCDGAVGLGDKLILVVAGDIDAVNIHTNGVGVNAAGVLVLNIVHVSVNTQGVGGEHGAVLNVGVIYTNRVDNGSVDIVDIGAVNELEVIEVKLACTLSADHFGAGNKHETEGHAGHEGERACPLGQICLKVLPAFPVDTGLDFPFAGLGIISVLDFLAFGLKSEVNLTLFAVAVVAIATQPQTGDEAAVSVLDAAVVDAYSFGSIDPNAKAGGSTGDLHLIGGTDACALGNGTAVSEVKVELQRMGAEADGFIVIKRSNLNGLLAASAVVRGLEDAGVDGYFLAGIGISLLLCAAVIILSGGDLAGHGIDIVLKVPNDGREHTHDNMDGSIDLLIVLRGRSDIAVKAVFAVCNKGVALEGTETFGTHRPNNVAVLDVKVTVLVADNEGEIALILKAKADFLGVEVNVIGNRNFDCRCADDLAALNHLDIDGTGLVACLEKAGFGIDGAHVLAVVGKSPCRIGGNCHGEACGVDAAGAELNLIARGVQVVVGGQCSVIEHAGGLCGGNNKQGGADLTLGAVRGRIADFELIAAFDAGCVGSRAAAVKHEDILCALSHVHFGDLLICTAAGNGGKHTVGDGGDNAAVLHDTYGGTAVVISAALEVLGAGLSVLDQRHPTADSGLAVAQIGIVSDNGGAVLQNSKVPAAACVVVLLALHDECAERLAGRHVEEVGIDGCNYGLTGVIFLVGGSLLGGGYHAPLGSIVLAVASYDLDGITEICTAHIIDLLIVAGRSVGNDLVLDNTVGDLGYCIFYQDLALGSVCPSLFR